MSERTATAQEIVSRYSKWTAGIGAVPLPVVGVAASTGVQLKMLCDLAKLYELPFQKDRAKAIVASLVASVAAPVLTGATLGLVGSAMLVPPVGVALTMVTGGALNWAATRALGRVFIQHFESGGTFLDMNPDSVREHFRQEFEAAAKSGGAGQGTAAAASR